MHGDIMGIICARTTNEIEKEAEAIIPGLT